MESIEKVAFGERRWLDIPAIRQLSGLDQWVCWDKIGEDRDISRKAPIHPNGSLANTMNPSTWSEMGDCFNATVNGQFTGIGFVFARTNRLIGIDLDHCIHGGKAEPWAQEIIDTLDTYTEYSPSRTGVHIIGSGTVPFKGRRTKGIEIYSEGRYFTVTSDIFPGASEEIRDIERLILPIIDKYQLDAPPTVGDLVLDADLVIDPDANPNPFLLEKARNNSRPFNKTWEHRRNDLPDQSLSSYDMSLAMQAAKMDWPLQEIANLIIAHRRERGSDRDLSKGVRRDYLERTIKKAIESNRKSIDDRAATALSSTPTSRDAALSTINSKLNMEVARVLQYGLEPATFAFELKDGKKISLGSIETLLSFPKVRAHLATHSKVLISNMKRDEWDGIVRAILSIVECEEVHEGEQSVLTRMWINGYVKRGVSYCETETEIGAALDSVSEQSELTIAYQGNAYFPLGRLRAFVIDEFKEPLTHHVLAVRLRMIGIEACSLNFITGGKRTNVRMWRAPMAFFEARLTPRDLAD